MRVKKEEQTEQTAWARWGQILGQVGVMEKNYKITLGIKEQNEAQKQPTNC